MPTYLIQINIGPVQDFIASARKLRDMWFGSYLLSELSKAVAAKLYELKANLIFPHVEDEAELKQDSGLIVANKILAEIETDDPAGIIKKTKDAWNALRKEVAAKTLAKTDEIGIKLNRSLYEAQKMDAGEFFGAWVELGDNYPKAKARLEKIMAGRKNLREFEAPAWNGTGIPKSSLDGLREAVTGDDQEEIVGLIKRNERLDALACIKRFYPLTGKREEMFFDDLTGIALVPWLEGISKSGLEDVVRGFIRNHNMKNSLARWKQDKPLDELELKDACTDYSEFFFYEPQKLKALEAINSYKAMVKQFGEPNKYSCIMVGDGDHMGKTLEQIETAKGHQVFTKHLGEFAKDVAKDVEKKQGSLIYSGGDDVMAYIPINKLVECAKAVKDQFAATMDKIFQDTELALQGEKPSFSAGVAIVHHKCPLDQALNLARKAESMAKTDGGRDALAIIQSKRSGSDVIICDKWEGLGEGRRGLISRLESMITLWNEEKLPGTLAFQLRQAQVQTGDGLDFEIKQIADSDGEALKSVLVPKNAASAMVLNIFEQKEHSEKLKDVLLGQKSIRNLSDEIIIAGQVAGAIKISEGKK